MSGIEIPGLSRRRLLQVSGLGLAGLSLTGGTALAATSAPLPPPQPIDRGSVADGKVKLDGLDDKSDPSAGPTPAPLPDGERLGLAIVGLGHLSLNQILPGFGKSMRCKPVALVSGDPDKMKTVAAQYDIAADSLYSYDDFDKIAQNPKIHAVYIVLPNAMHKEFVIRAAKAGKHVLCEKPMAVSSAEAREMIDACNQAKVKLMIAYRCQYEPHHMALIGLARSKQLGDLKLIRAVNGQRVGPVDQWRLKKAMAGGGPLPDVGIYCLNAARYVTGEEPVEIEAQIRRNPDDPHFREVEESIAFLARFPSGVIASCEASYNIYEARQLTAHLTEGTLDLENAFGYQGQQLYLSRVFGPNGTRTLLEIPPRDHFAAEMDDFARAVHEDRKPHTPGEEGLQDLLLIEAIYKSAEARAPVTLPKVEGLDTTRGPAPKGP